MIISAEHFLELIKKEKKLSETIIPELIKRLIRETIDCGAYTRFPANDDVFVPGPDGVVNGNKTLHRFLPLGDLYFEIGAKTTLYKSLNKIDSDYQTRKNDITIKEKEKYTYIAVTTGILDSKIKEEKCKYYNKEKVFKSVLILDAIDITNWMEEHVNISIWFLKEYGEKIDDFDINLVSEEWERISKATKPNLSNELFIVGNESNSKKILQDLQESTDNKIFTISAEHYGRDFAYAFCVSSIMTSSNKELIHRSIVVNSQSAMNYVNAFCKNKIVLVNFNCLDDRFAIAMNNTYIFFDTLFDVDVKLNMVQQNGFVKEVVKLGYTETESSRISFIVDYNVLVLRRLLAKIPSIKVPQWSKSLNKNELIPLLLMGEINMDNTGDLEFLKAVVGDDIDAYTEKLNIWSENNQSPIMKYDNIYKINARKESFDFLQIDMFSLKLKRIEQQMELALSSSNKKHNMRKNKCIINDCSYKWSDRLINNVLDGFIILSEKNKNYQIHFDSFLDKIFNNFYGNYRLELTNSHHFKKLSELSPNSYIKFLCNSIKNDKENFLKFINTTTSGFMMNGKHISYVLSALDNVLSNDKYALLGLEALLDLYYLCDAQIVADEVVKYFSPIATMAGLVAMPVFRKTELLFRYIENKDYNKTFKIIDMLYKNGNNTISSFESHSYKNSVDIKIAVTYTEIFDLKSRAFNWLVENENDANKLLQTLKNLLQNIHEVPFEDTNRQLLMIEGKLINENDEVKAKAYREVMRTREHILQYNNWNYLNKYLPVFDEFLKAIKPIDDYIYRKYMLIDDSYPLLDPPSLDDDDWYERTNELRVGDKKRILKELIDIYGQPIIEKIAKDSLDNSSLIWPLLYETSDDHNRDFKILVENKVMNGIRIYMQCMNELEIDRVLKEYECNSIVIQNLPYSKKIYTWIDGKSKEKEYWENQYFDKTNDADFEYLFGKFIDFAPEKLLGACSYFVEIDYEHSLKLLNAISNLVENQSKLNEINREAYYIQDFVKKLDQKYFTDELSLCEFKLLPVLKSGIEDYPIGIKKYFWDHPEELGNILANLYEQRKTLPSGSMGQKILFEAEFSFGAGCYIPKEYITQNRSNIKFWVDGVLSTAKNKDTRILLKRAIINTLAACPKQINDDVWPIKEVADILESLAKEDYEDKFEVSSCFSAGYNNRRGFRSINDGTLEFSLSEVFKKYQAHYQFSHPITSRALEYISNGYNYEAEMDRKRAHLG